jgi:hypothetical protein
MMAVGIRVRKKKRERLQTGKRKLLEKGSSSDDKKRQHPEQKPEELLGRAVQQLSASRSCRSAFCEVNLMRACEEGEKRRGVDACECEKPVVVGVEVVQAVLAGDRC